MVIIVTVNGAVRVIAVAVAYFVAVAIVNTDVCSDYDFAVKYEEYKFCRQIT